MNRNLIFAIVLLTIISLGFQGCFKKNDDNSITGIEQEPWIIITYPAQWGTVQGIEEVRIEAGPESVIDSVTLLIDGIEAQTDTVSPYIFSWDTQGLKGPHTLLAKAHFEGKSLQSSLITVNVEDTADANPPYVRITSPADWAQISGMVTVRAEAADDRGISRLEFSVDGIMGASAENPPYEFNWNTIDWVNGEHTLIARAYDWSNNMSLSNMITVTVEN